MFDESNHDVTPLSGFTDIQFPANKEDRELFCVQKDGKYGYITRTGEANIPFLYEQALGNSYDMMAVKKDGKWGIITADNTVVIPTEYYNVCLPGERDTKHFWVMKSDSLYYHYNMVTNNVSGTGYKSVTNFQNGIAHVAPFGMVVSDSPINRAQMYAPNAPKADLDSVNIKKSIGAFGYLVNTEDVVLMDLPVSTMYKDAVVKEINRLGGRPLTATEMKRILLEATRENRYYDLKATLSEEEWNY